jgi:16S rRNA processing protein RimM
MDNLVKIGFTKKPHGLKGEIKLQIDDHYMEDLLETDVVLLTIKGKPTPYFIEDIRVGNAIIAKFEDVDSVEAATEIGSKELSLREKDILADEERTFEEEEGMEYADCVGYKIMDGDVVVGTIEEVVEFPQQEMAILTREGKDILIPLNVAFVLRRDDAAKTIFMDLPKGLLEL